MGRRFFLIVALLLILFLVLSVTVTVFLVEQRTTYFGRAQNSRKGGVIVENSYLFASPLSAKADGKEKIRVTVFILNSQGLGIAGKRVVLGQDQRLTIKEVQPITDSYGKAIFDLSSATPGEYLIEAVVDHQVLPQRVKVRFR